MTSINPIYRTDYNPPAKAKQHNAPATTPVESVSNVVFEGTQALAAYNYNLVNKNHDFDIPTIKPIAIPENLTKIDGTKVYDSKNNLVVVKKKVGDKEYVYHNNEDKTIEVFNSNGDKIQEQEFFVNIEKEKILITRKFIPGSKDTYQTSYISENSKDFELLDKAKHIYYPNGTSKEFIHYVKDKTYDVIEHSGTNYSNYLFNKSIQYDENKNVKYIVEHSAEKDSYKKINYKDGIPYQIEEECSTVIPNNILENMDFLNDKDLVPHEKFKFQPNAKEVNGKKTYYSDGTLETNTFMQDGKEVTYSYLTNGDLINVLCGDFVVECDGTDGYEIHEKLKNGAIKDTTYSGDSVYVYVSDENNEKFVTYKDNHPVEYSKFKNREGISYSFNSDGSLRSFNESKLGL